jgi:hypothetical protein
MQQSFREWLPSSLVGRIYLIFIGVLAMLGLLRQLEDSGIINGITGAAMVIPPFGWFLMSGAGLLFGSFVAFHRLRLERDELRAFYTREGWEEDFKSLRDGAQTFWPVLIDAFMRWRNMEASSLGESLFRAHVDEAPWPPDTTKHSRILLEFTDKVFPESESGLLEDLPSFQLLQRDMARVFEKWGEFLTAASSGTEQFEEFLKRDVCYFHHPTLKLLMYLEDAREWRTGNEEGLDFTTLETVLEVFQEASQPVELLREGG